MAKALTTKANNHLGQPRPEVLILLIDSTLSETKAELLHKPRGADAVSIVVLKAERGRTPKAWPKSQATDQSQASRLQSLIWRKQEDKNRD